MIDILNSIPTTITQIDNSYHIIYKINDHVGGCSYKEWTNKSKFQLSPVYILTEVNMVDIISYINDLSPLNDNDLHQLQMDIRNHSLNILNKFISNPGGNN